MAEFDTNLVTYIKELGDKPFLSFERQKELSKIIQSRRSIYAIIEDKDKRKEAEKQDKIISDAIEELVNNGLGLVLKEAFRFYRSTGVSIKDLIGSGNIGLMKAAYKYDAEHFNTRFSTYATFWIRQAMFSSIHASGLITIPIHILNGRSNHNKLLDEDANITDEEIMKQLEIDEAQLQRIKDANVHVISLDQPVTNGGSDQDNLKIGDLIADEKASDPSESSISVDRYRFLHAALAELDDMSRDIVTAQILDDDKVKLRELGEKYGKTGERIRQIREKALKKLRTKIQCNISLQKVKNDK